jgi:fluoride exporter
MLNGLLVFLGGGLGSVIRWWISGLASERWGHTFPWGTIIVNVSGSLVIGFLAASTGPDGRWPAASAARVFFMVGVCGGYTTFSAFSLQTLELMQSGHVLDAAKNIVLSVTLCLLGVWLGHVLGSEPNASSRV